MGRIKIGNLYAVETKKGIGYCQNNAYDDFFGHMIRVLPRLYQEEPNLEELVNGETKFYTFTPIGWAARSKEFPEIYKIGHYPLPEHEQKLPIIRSDVCYHKSTGKYEAWIYDGNYRNGEHRYDLTEEILKMSERSRPSWLLLIDWIEKDWHPALEKIYIED